MRNHYTASEISIIQTHYPILGADECVKLLHNRWTANQIRRKAQKIGIVLRSDVRGAIYSKYKQLKIKDSTAYSVNPDQFFNVTTPEIAYILGFLWADGYISGAPRHHTIGLGIQRYDFDNYVLPVLHKVGKWQILYHQQMNRKEQGRARISNKPLYTFLQSHNYQQKNLSHISIVNHIPDALRKYWFRGLFDGDGCVYVSNKSNNVSICGPYEQDWSCIIQLFNTLGIDHYGIHRRESSGGNNSTIHLSSYSNILKFLGYIYDGFVSDGIGFMRKYEKYIRIIEKACRNVPTSLFKGVTKLKNGKFQAKFSKKPYIKFLGTFNTEGEAANAYDEYMKSIL